MGKKILIILKSISIVIVLLITAFYLKPAKTDFGVSNLYSQEEIESAMDVVDEKFVNLNGCKLLEMCYVGDDESKMKFGYCEDYNEAILINARFLSPIVKKDFWEPHTIYVWKFLLMRQTDGNWEIISYDDN